LIASLSQHHEALVNMMLKLTFPTATCGFRKEALRMNPCKSYFMFSARFFSVAATLKMSHNPSSG
jgi:hypothetical protein